METPTSGTKTGRAVLGAFATALLVKMFIADLMIADGRSMLPTIRPGTVLIVNRAAYGIRCPFADRYLVRWAFPRRGDIVVFLSADGKLAVKRCVAGPGDPVPENMPLASAVRSVPADRFLAMGDNRDESFDSRNYGLVPIDGVRGRALGL